MEARSTRRSAFARANPIDRVEWGHEGASFGIVTTGKAHLDLLEALRLLGIDEERASSWASISTRSAWSGHWRGTMR